MSQFISDLSEARIGVGLVPQVLAATAQGTALDGTNFEVSTQMVVEGGAFGANSTSAVIVLEECATTNGTFTQVQAAPGSATSFTLTTSNQSSVLRGIRTLQYVRGNALTVAGTTPAIAVEASIYGMPKSSGGATSTGYSRSPSV